MTYRRFATFNVVGAILWITSMSLTGYFLGLAVGPETLEKHIHLVVARGHLPVAAAGDHRLAEVEARDGRGAVARPDRRKATNSRTASSNARTTAYRSGRETSAFTSHQ